MKYLLHKITIRKLETTLVFGFFLFTIPLFGSTELPRVINHLQPNTSDFNQIWSIDQAENGFMYFGTTGGLLEYNGTSWKQYPMPNQQVIRSVAIDETQRVFVGGFETFGFWQYDTSKGLTYQSLVPLIPQNALGKEQIWNILIDKASIYSQSFARIFKYNNNTIQLIQPPSNIMFGQQFGDDIIYPFIGKGLARFSTASGNFSLIENSQVFASKQVEFIINTHDQNVIIGTKNTGLYIGKDHQYEDFNTSLNQQIKEFQLNKGIQLSNGYLAIGTILNGVYIIDDQGRIIYHFNKKNGLQNNTILSLKEDENKNLWVGTDKGIDLILLNEPLVFYEDRAGDLGTVYCASLYKDNIYLGTNQAVFRKSQNQPNFEMLEGTQGQVWDLKIIGDEIICGHNTGTLAINKDKVRKISDVTGGYKLIPIPWMPNYFIQGTYTGLVIFESTSSGLQFHKRLLGFSESSKFLAFDNEGKLWVAHPNRGLHQITLNHQSFEVDSFLEFNKKHALPSTYKLEVLRFNNKILVKSDGKYFEFDHTKQLFKAYHSNIFDEVEANYTLVQLDPKNRCRIFKDKVEWATKDKYLEFNIALYHEAPFISKHRKGQLFFCLPNGYAKVSKRRLKKNTPLKDETLIYKIEKPEGQIFFPTDSQTLHFSAKERNLKIYFANTTYERKAAFSYRLLGFSDNWSDYESTAFKEFFNLKGGQYTLELRSKKDPEKIASVSFSIAYYWHETSIVFFLILIMLVILLFGLYKWHAYRLSKLEQAQLKRLQEERIKSSNEKLQIELKNKSKELANSTINLIQKNELLTGLKERLDALKKEHKSIQYSKSFNNLVQLVQKNRSTEKDIALFDESFEQVHEEFYQKLKKQFPELTTGDMKLAAFLRMNLNTKEIAPLLNISVRGVENKRYRLRKKMHLSADDNLTDAIMNI